ncbi:hypothetical protein ACHAWF_002237 [Thalassiosira exigua]
MSKTAGVASCWICLEEGADESSQPLRRDCSCRADNGFAHLPCLVQYAKTKSTSGEEGSDVVWEICPSCKQEYQKDLALDLANTHLQFIEEVYTNPLQRDTLLVRALDYKARTIVTLDKGAEKSQQLRMEGKQAANKMLSLIGRVKKIGSEESTDMVEPYEGMALGHLGMLCYMDFTDAGLKMSIVYHKRMRDLGKKLGEDLLILSAEERIAMAEDRLGKERLNIHGDDEIDRELDHEKAIYARVLNACGKNDLQTLRAGTNVARVLIRDRRVIAAQRLLTELVSTSQLVHGKEHATTKAIETVLRTAKMRIVMLFAMSKSGEWKPSGRFEALRYVNNGKDCIIKGPVPENTDFRDLSKEKTFTVDSRQLCYQLSTPVVCHGLAKAAHLNGKIGDIRSGNTATNRFGVYFEDASVKPRRAEVKLENLRIVFDLPGENMAP